MKEYKLKTPVQAFQYGEEPPEWFTHALETRRFILNSEKTTKGDILITLMDGYSDMKYIIHHGDYFVRNALGEISVYSPEAFNLVYELVKGE